MSIFPFLRWAAVWPSFGLIALILVGCATEPAASDPQQSLTATSSPTSTTTPTPTIQLRPTFTPIPTPDTTKQMADAMEAVQFIATNKHYIGGIGTRNLCHGRYSLDAADELRVDIAGFEGRLVDKGHRELGAGLEETSFDGWEPELRRTARNLARRLEKEVGNIIQHCYKS